MKGVNKYREMNDGRLRKGLVVLQREGFIVFFYRTGHYLKRLFLRQISPIVIKYGPKGYFMFQNKRLPYFLHTKSLTWTNERAIEVPIAHSYISEDKRILEVGAVLYHYYPDLKKDVLDKFEKGQGIINEDVIVYQPTLKYDLIISISTLEHVGYDDDVKDQEGTLKAIQNLKTNCLNKNGQMIITLPISYNKDVDKMLFAGKLEFDEEYYFKKTNLFNQWREITREEAKTAQYKHHAETIVVGIIRSGRDN